MGHPASLSTSVRPSPAPSCGTGWGTRYALFLSGHRGGAEDARISARKAGVTSVAPGEGVSRNPGNVVPPKDKSQRDETTNSS